MRIGISNLNSKCPLGPKNRQDDIFSVFVTYSLFQISSLTSCPSIIICSNSKFRSSTADSPIITQGISDDRGLTTGAAQLSTSARGMFGDAILTILTNKNNPVVEVRFQDLFPVALGALDFTQTATDVEYISVTADFSYKIYDIVTI